MKTTITRIGFICMILGILILLALPITACSQSTGSPSTPDAGPSAPAASPQPEAEKVEIKVVTFLPPSEPRMIIFKDLLSLIEEKSDGAITCDYLGGAEVVGTHELGDNVKLGNIQMAVSPGAFFSGLVPAAGMISLSQYTGPEERERGLWDALQPIFAPANLYPYGRFMPHNDPAYYVGLRKVKPTSISDFAGLKIGFGSPINKKWVEELGGTFVQTPLADGYTALDRGVVDGFTGTVGDHLNYGYCEVEKYIVDHAVYGNNGYIILNLELWNDLPQNLKEAMTSALEEWEPMSMQLQRESEAQQKQEIIDKPGAAEFVALPPAEAEKYVNAVYTAEWPAWESKCPEETKILRPLMSQ